MTLEALDAKLVDIDNAFLNGDLDHEIFMKIPEGYKECIQEYDGDKALKLDKAIYGLVQAARLFCSKKQGLNQASWIHVYFNAKMTED